MASGLVIGAVLADNDPRMEGRTLTVWRVTGEYVTARDSQGRDFCYKRERIFTDGKPRRHGMNLLPTKPPTEEDAK